MLGVVTFSYQGTLLCGHFLHSFHRFEQLFVEELQFHNYSIDLKVTCDLNLQCKS